MRLIIFLTFFIGVELVTSEMNFFQLSRLLALTVLRVFALDIRTLQRFAAVGARLNCLSALLQLRMAVLQFLLNQGLRTAPTVVEVTGIVYLAILITVAEKASTGSAAVPRLAWSGPNSYLWTNEFQSASASLQQA
jgi:hypothetical protein